MKAFDATEVVLRIENLLEARLLYLGLALQKNALECKVRERTHQLEAALRGAEAASEVGRGSVFSIMLSDAAELPRLLTDASEPSWRAKDGHERHTEDGAANSGRSAA